MALSDASIRALKPKTAAYAVTDEKGLTLQVTSTGSKLWRFRYQFGGKPRVMSFGGYPEVPLAEARRKRDESFSNLQADLQREMSAKKEEVLAAARREAEAERQQSARAIDDRRVHLDGALGQCDRFEVLGIGELGGIGEVIADVVLRRAFHHHADLVLP